MSRDNKWSRAMVMTSLVAAGALVAIVAPAAQTSNFAGGTPSTIDSKAIRTSRLKFPAGSRSNWHSHTWGQLLMIEEGRARTQVRGGPVMEMLPGQPWFTKAGIEHWHGAAPDQDALQLTIYEGDVKWLEPVTDAQYAVPPKK